jgi:superfamily II DNA or RNA helicase
MTKKYSYSDTENEDFQYDTFKKREFYYHRVSKRDILKSKEDIEDYRNQICRGDLKLRNQQILLTNFFSPNTPYNGLLLMHGTGTGKTCTAISIAEQFKEQIKKYNTHIYVLVPGTNIKENFKKELLFCTGETYLKNKELLEQLTLDEQEKERKISIYSALQYYKILSYKTFLRKVLGEKITEKKLSNNDKIKSKYKKTESGDFEREIVIDRIQNMNNSLIIIDEAHNISGNDYGEALKHIIKISKNLKVLLLTATPMKNFGDDIIDMLNFLRPSDSPIKRDKVFNSKHNYNMDFKPGGKEYLKKMAHGYVSFFRGNMPYTFADRIDMGELIGNMLFTPVIKSFMTNFQLNTYKKTEKEISDGLERASSAAANFVYPGLNSNNKLIGYYSGEGLKKVLTQINNPNLIKLINKELFNNKIDKNDIKDFLLRSENKNITGNILKKKYLKTFSVKFYNCLKNLEELVEHKEGPQTSFIYSNLVNAGGMELFAEVLKMNGYLEYKENKSEYDITDNIIDYRTGLNYGEYKNKKLNLNHFYPATFLLVTGNSDDSNDEIPEVKQKIIRTVFNSFSNREAKFIKFILGSRVMSEGITLENVQSVHILDVHYNLGRVEQVIGRAIRDCKHQAIINKNNFFPKVKVYRYVISIQNKLTSDEKLYQKAEQKFLLVKKVERQLKEVAIDCPLLLHNNKFPEEIKKYKNCVEPTSENIKQKKNICPMTCDFQSCDFKCDNKKLNKEYYKNGTYKNLDVKEIDFGTFNDTLAKAEISDIKEKIKDLYRFNHVYIYDEILNKIKKSFSEHQSKLFNTIYLDKGLEDLMPRTENDYNSFKDTIYDKYNRTGYLIQRGKYFIFQPFDDNENIPLFYRQNFELNTKNNIPVKNYIEEKYSEIIKTTEDNITEVSIIKDKKKYDFDSVMDYYTKRNDNFIVGIIDKSPRSYEKEDIFKIRPPITKSDLKRGKGIFNFKGAVCITRDMDFIHKNINKLKKEFKKFDNIPFEFKNSRKRNVLCEQIKNSLIYLEKYSTGSNKRNYLMIPANHPTYEFPFNLEDRVKYIINNVNKIIERKYDYTVNKENKGMKYTIIIKTNKYIDNKENKIKKLGFIKNKSHFIKTII